MKKRLRIGVLFGGRSGEYEVSLVSARAVISNLNKKKYSVIPIKISKTGRFVNINAIFEYLIKNCDAVFPVLHGTYGEDGTIQGMLELADIPYVGCGVFASAAGMDKFASKIIFKAYNLPQAKFIHASRQELKKNFPALQLEVAEKLGFPCFVKPANLGSSVGISKVKKMDQLKSALSLAAQFDNSIVIEEGIDAREIECSVLGNENPVASVAGEIIPSGEFYDYYAKYVDNKSIPIIPAKLPVKKMREVQTLALRAYKGLQCTGMARVDFLMDKRSGKLYLNEINTIPGFTSISMYPKLWEASGLSYSKLLDRLIELAIAHYREKKKNKVSFESGSDWYKK